MASSGFYDLLKTKAPFDYLQLKIDEGCLEEVLKYLQEHPARPDTYYAVD